MIYFFRWEKFTYAILLLILAIFIVLLILCGIQSRTWIGKTFPGFLVSQNLFVTSLSRFTWTGSQHGLRFPDKIVAVDGLTVKNGKDIIAIASNKEPGFLLEYRVLRDNKLLELKIPTMKFTEIDLFLVYGTMALQGIAFFLIGITVFYLKFATQISWAFLTACYLSAVQSILSFDLCTTYVIPHEIYKIAFGFGPAASLHFLFHFPKTIRLKKRCLWLQYIPYLISLFLVIPYVSLYPKPASLIYYQLIQLFALIVSIIFLINMLRQFLIETAPLSRQRSKLVIFGGIIAFTVPLLIGVWQQYMGSFFSKYVPTNYLNITVILFPAVIAYAIIKHNLFDVDVYIKRTVGYVIMTALVAITYFVIQTSLTQFVLQPLLGAQASNVYPILFALLVVFVFNPLNAKVQRLVDRLFYRSQFDYKEMVLAIGNALSSVLNLPEIVNRIIGTVRQDMFIESAGLIVMGKDKEGYLPLFSGAEQIGKATDLASGNRLSPSDPIIHLMEKERKLITRYDLEEDPRYQEHYAACGPRFQELGATLALPLISHDKLVGVLLVGDKKSGKFYNREEIDLLRTLANEGAVALQNASLLEENVQKSRMDEELKIARDIQMSMLPDRPPEMKGFSIAAKSYPAREVGGDFYDFINLSGDEHTRVAIVVGDVSGKAVSGALVMAASRSVLRVLSEAHHSVEAIMNFGNTRLCSDVRKGMFVALLYAVADSRHLTLTLSNAGQTQPILCPAQGGPPAYIETEGDCFPLGIIPDCQYQETRVTLQPGDTVAFYTDGIVEASNAQDELYGFERLLAILDEVRALDADAQLDRILDDVNAHVGDAEQHDDITLVILKVA